MVVGIDSDSKISSEKGDGRPINSQSDRKFVLESISYVDRVVIFYTSNELSGLVEKFSPDIMVIGSDWEGKNIVGGKFAGKIQYFKRIGAYSTTAILNKIGGVDNENC